MNQNFLVSKYSLNLFVNVMRTALITRNNIKMFLYNIMKVLILSGKASQEFKDALITIANKTPLLTPYTKAEIRNGYLNSTRIIIISVLEI